MQFKNYADFARTKGAKDEGPRKRRGEALRERGRSFLNSARERIEPYSEKAVDYINPKRKALREALATELTTKKRQSDRKKKAAMIAGGVAGAGATGLAAARYGNDFLKRRSLKRNMPFEMGQSYGKTSNLLKRDIKQAVSGARSKARQIGNIVKGNPRKVGGGILGAGLTAAGVLAYLKNKKKKGE
jgi:hypothetical protein